MSHRKESPEAITELLQALLGMLVIIQSQDSSKSVIQFVHIII